MSREDYQAGMLWALAVLGALAAAVAGGLIYLLWSHLHLPDAPPPGFMASFARPYGLAKFMYLGFPLAVWVPTLVLSVLLALDTAPPEGMDRRRILLLDALSYFFLPPVVLLPVLWDQLGNVWLALGLLFMGLLTFKGWLLIRVAWQGFLSPLARRGSRLGWRGQAAVFLVAAVIFLLTAGWVQQAVSSVGAEVDNLLVIHYLGQGEEPLPAILVERSDYQGFYWERWDPALRLERQHTGPRILARLLIPAYSLGGRAGVLAALAVLAALLAAQLLAWLEQVGVRPGPAALATLLTMLSAPVFFHAQQVLPAIPAALVLVVGLRMLALVESRPWWGGVGALAAAILVTLLAVNLLPVSVGLVVAWFGLALQRQGGWRWAWPAMALVVTGLGVGLALVPAADWPALLRLALADGCREGSQAYPWWRTAWIALRGLGLDQAFGVLFTAPVFLLALGGLPATLARRPGPAVAALLPAGLLLAAVVHTQWCQWFGGFAAPGRLVAAVLPVGALFMAPCLAALARPWQRLAVLLPAGLGLAYVWVLTLMPPLRFSSAVGINRLVDVVQGLLSLVIYHLLPSTQLYSPLLSWWVAGAALVVAALAVVTWRSRSAWPAKPYPRLSSNEIAALVLVAAVGLGGLLAAARFNPPRLLEAELMVSAKAPIWADYAYPHRPRGRALQDGDSIAGWLHFPGGRASLRLQGFSRLPGVVRVALDGVDKAGIRYQGDRDLVVELGQVKAGGHRVRVTWRSCSEPDCFLVVDKVVRQ